MPPGSSWGSRGQKWLSVEGRWEWIATPEDEAGRGDSCAEKGTGSTLGAALPEESGQQLGQPSMEVCGWKQGIVPVRERMVS